MYAEINGIVHATSCKRYKKAESNGETINTLPIDEITGYPYKWCKCCKQVLSNYTKAQELKNNYQSFLNLLYQYCNNYNYRIEIFDNQDIKISTSVEKWIVQFISIAPNEARIVLWHKNNLLFNPQSNKCGNSIYPDYHVQFKDSLTPFEVVKYINKHESEKWGVRTVCSVTQEAK